MTAEPAAAAVTVDVMVTAYLPVPYGYVYRAGGNAFRRIRAGLRGAANALRCPCLAFVVRHPAAGAILVDTGLHADACANPRADFGFPMGLVFKDLQPAGPSFDAQLRELGIDPHEVDQVVMTHLHVDHTSAMRLLPRATFTCTRDEWAATRGPLAVGKGYVARHLPPASRMSLVDIERHGLAYGPFMKTLDLFGDGSIRLLSTPGHTAGHVSVLLRIADGPPVVLVGDAAYTRRSIDEGILPMLTHDDEASCRSLQALRDFVLSEPAAILVPTHDPDAWRALQHTGSTTR
jgi:glyoxylase-like metal-dependent hydrolase (beta-lactamase superfamily II)